jgi:DNA polymerase/3'-5' exonuclease PolX
MSQGKAMPLVAAQEVATELRGMLAPACTRIAIAGSIRREKETVSDIELVAVPLIEEADGGDLWGTPVELDRLNDLVAKLMEVRLLQPRAVESHRADGSVTTGERMGSAYKALVYRDMPVDLFIVRSPAQWGVIFTIRTGPAEWSHRLVTDCQKYLRRVAGGQVWRAGQLVPCPEEEDFFRTVGQPWVEPRERSAARVHIQKVAA